MRIMILGLLSAPLLAAQKVELRLDQLKSKAADVSEQNLEGAALESFLNMQLVALETAGKAGRTPSKPRRIPR